MDRPTAKRTWLRTLLTNGRLVSESSRVKPKPTELPQQQAQQPQPIVFRVNILAPVANAPGGSLFFQAGVASPYHDISEVPDHLRAFIVSGEPETEPPADKPIGLTFSLNEPYAIDRDGYRRAKEIERQIVNLERGQEDLEAAERALNADPDEQTRAALEVVQGNHDAAVARAMAQAEYAAKERDMANEFAQRMIDEQDDKEVNEL